MKKFSNLNHYVVILLVLIFYWLFVAIGIKLSIPIQVIPDETTQLLNIYGMIQNISLKLPYESAYTFWVHITLLPFTALYWLVEYFIQGLPNLESFKTYVAVNYMNVLPFLRLVSTAFLLYSTWLISIVVTEKIGKKAAILLVIFFLSDLLVFINLHYSKHWMIDLSWIFISIYAYHRYLHTESKYLFYISIISFFIGVYSSQPLFIAFLYHLYLYAESDQSQKSFISDLIVAILVGIIFLVITLWLGPGKIIGEIFNNASTTQLNASIEIAPQFLISLFDYNPFLTIVSLLLFFHAILKKNYRALLLSFPFFGYLVLISTFHYEPRYSLFLVIAMSIFSALAMEKIMSYRVLVLTVGVMLIFNLALLTSWHNIANAKDTRVMASEWLNDNYLDNSFIIYNTLGFNYIPLSKDGIGFIHKEFPNAIGTREKLHISLKLPDGMNGIILRKIEEGRYIGSEFISKLIHSGYQPILLNERFGEDAYFHQPAIVTYENILKNCNYHILEKFMPYSKKPEDFEKYGDILYNFTNVIKSLILFDRPGPIMTIYIFDNNQPNTCI
jgi:hypothetical protein